MKKADALKAVIKEIKDQNRSSFGPDDLESFKKKLGKKLTTSLAMDFRVEAAKAGIEAPENLSLNDMLPERRASAAEIEAGVSPGKQVAERATEVAKSGKGLASQSIKLSDEGLTLLLAQIEIDGGANKTFIDNPRLAAKEHTARNVEAFKEATEKNLLPTKSNNTSLRRVHSRLHKYSAELAQEFFPNIELYDNVKAIQEALDGVKPSKTLAYSSQIQDAYIQLLYERGWLEDADPDLVDLDKELSKLPKSERNRKSTQGRPLVDTKKAKGVPLAVGVDPDGQIIYDPNRTRPYHLKISEEGKKHLKETKSGTTKIGRKIGKVVTELPSIVLDKLPAEVPPTKNMDEQLRESRKTYYQTRAIRGDEPPLANKVTSERTGKVYDNYNQMVATEGSPPVPGGETVEPNRGEASRRARGAVIVRSDVNTFKQAMGKAVSKGDKGNLFTEIVNEARKIDPKVSMDAMQDIKDYLFFTGYLEADKEVSGKVGPSRLSDADVPEYIKPSQKYYKQGLKVLDAGGENQPLVIRKLSADPDIQSMSGGARSVPEIAGPQAATPDKPVSERTSRLLNIIKSGGRKGLKVLVPGVGLAATAIEEAAAATPTARSSFSEIEYDRMMEEAKREELVPPESELRGRTMEEVKSRTSFMNQ